MDTFFGLYFPSAESYHWKLKPKVLYQILFEFMTGESRGGSMGSMEPPFAFVRAAFKNTIHAQTYCKLDTLFVD